MTNVSDFWADPSPVEIAFAGLAAEVLGIEARVRTLSDEEFRAERSEVETLIAESPSATGGYVLRLVYTTEASRRGSDPVWPA